jgi:prevent-host-death family protein
MKCVSVVDLRSNLAELLNRVQYGGERVTVTRNGRPAAVIISQDDLEYFEALEDYFDINEANKALEEAKQEGTISWEEYLKEVE